LLRELANRTRAEPRAILELGAAIFGLAAQERAEEAGPIGRALPSAPTVEAWQGIVEAARAYRDTIRAHHEVATPSYMARALAPWGLGFLATLAFIAGVGGIGSALTGAFTFPTIDLQESLGLLLGSAFLGALAFFLAASDRATVIALNRTAAALNGRTEKGRRAIYQQLDWLDQHNWGPSPMVIMSPGRGDHYTVAGDVRGRPVLITQTRRGAPRPRHGRSEWAAIEDGPSHELTNVFIPMPAEQERTLSPHVAKLLESAGVVAEVGRDGVRLSRNDAQVDNLSPDRLLPILETVLDPAALVLVNPTNDGDRQ